MSEEQVDHDEFDDEFDDDWEWVPYQKMIENEMSPKIKAYLAEYFGDDMLKLESETYLRLDELISKYHLGADNILDDLYHNMTITKEAWNDYIDTHEYHGETYEWPKPKHKWRSEEEEEVDEEFEEFLREGEFMEMTEEERKNFEITKSISQLQFNDPGRNKFIRVGYEMLSEELYSYFLRSINCNLSVTTEKGFEIVAETIYWMYTEMLDHLYGVVSNDIEDREGV